MKVTKVSAYGHVWDVEFGDCITLSRINRCGDEVVMTFSKGGFELFFRDHGHVCTDKQKKCSMNAEPDVKIEDISIEPTEDGVREILADSGIVGDEADGFVAMMRQLGELK